jgi:hypothetical protein
MNQYSEKKVAVLLKSPVRESSNFKIVNGMAEFTLDGERVVVPTAEAFHRLLKKVAVLEQRLASTDNKATRATRTRKNNE